MKESDLYLPLKRFLEAQGYEVKGEVGDCDMLAVRGGESPLIVELKLSMNLTVLLQVVERLALSEQVYIGIWGACKAFRRNRRPILKLLKMLGIGLMVIEPSRKNAPVEVLTDPANYRPRISKPRQGRLLGEFNKRLGDPNLGGMAKRQGIMTAYRQRSLAIARFLEEKGPHKASDIARQVGEPQAREIMYRNVYGWFERLGQGIYTLSPRGTGDVRVWLEKSAPK